MRLPLLKISLALAVAAGVLIGITPQPAQAAVIPVGAGSYRDDRPAGEAGPSNSDGAAVSPKVTSAVAGRPVPTNDWWSSLVWQRYAGNPYSENMYAHPLSFHAYGNGLGVGYPASAGITPDQRTYEHIHQDDLRVGVTGLAAPRTEVDGWGDWHVVARWTDGARTLRTTIAHGSPYVFASASGGTSRVDFLGAASVFSNSGTVVGVTINGHHYGLFSTSSWSVSGGFATTSAGSYSVAVLPSTGALSLYNTYARNVITDTRVSWSYDAANGNVTATYAITTSPSGGTLTALYRHQWLTTTSPLTTHTYASSRGQMRVREGSSFTTVSGFNGVLPALPIAADADHNRLRSEIDAVLAAPDKFQGATDTYWTGKALWRLAALVPVANQIGHTGARDQLLSLIKGRLAEWLTSGGSGQFMYDANWDTLIGYPASYGSDRELNDHHFHYGYFVLAAAIVAQHDSAWASSSQYGGMVKLLVKDPANYDRGDTQFPFLRNFDPFAGHSWASGHAGFGHGNNQESSSEAMMFATAMVLFGQATGDTAMRNAGIYIYTTERDAVGQYWFDKDGAVFPGNYQHDTLGILWGAGGAYATWWTANPEEIHGINMLPITGGSLYNGHWKPDITQNINELRASNGGQETEWRDIIWSFLAMADPSAAHSLWIGANPAPEWGESRAHTYHWISSLRGWGTPSSTVTGNTPTSAVLGSGTYVAYNPGSSDITVTFSNGATLPVPARAMAWRGPAGSGVEHGGGGGIDPPPGETSYEAEAAGNTRSGATRPRSCSACSGGQKIGWIGNNTSNWLRFNGVSVATAGSYTMRVAALVSGTRSFSISVNGGAPQTLSVSGSSWSTPTTRDVTVSLNAGSNTIRFYNNSAWTPDLDRITIVGGGTSPSPSPSPTPTQSPPSCANPLSGNTFSLGSSGSASIPSAGGQNWDGTPHNPVTFNACGVNGTHAGGVTSFDLFVDAGSAVGNGTQVRVSYDFTGDGSWDRVETYRYFATDPVAGWEHYTQSAGLHSSSGALASFSSGKVMVEVWNAIGNGPSTLGTATQSFVRLPF